MMMGHALCMVVCLCLLCTPCRAEETSPEETYYVETPRDGDPGKSIADMVPSLAKNDASQPDWMADVASRIQLHGYAQGIFYAQHVRNAQGERENKSSFLCKRVIWWANAQITKRWSFLFMHNICGSVLEYYIDFRITNNSALNVRFGQFKSCLSLENPFSPSALETIDNYSEGVSYLAGVSNDPLYGGQGGREQGIALFGETNDKKFRYEFQLLNGSGTNVADRNNQKDYLARFDVRPAKGLNLCVTGQLGKGNALVGGTIFNPTLKAGDNYRRNRWTAGADYKSRHFNAHGEYLWGQDGDVKSQGAYLTGSVPILPGTLDLVASYDYFDFNTTQQMDMHKVVAGVQYWFFKKCRLQAQYVYKSASTDYKSYFCPGANHGIMCQMQVRFN